MTSDSFEYDVFLSFASDDQDLVRPLWQELSLSGLRVFWSDSSLRDRVGTSWFDIIQDSLNRSQHLLIVFTSTALKSNWVKREYVAFFNHCHRPPERLLIPVLAAGCEYTDLPLFLREIESCRLDDSNVVSRLVRLLGGTDIEGLRRELSKARDEITQLRTERNALLAHNAELEQRLLDDERRYADELQMLGAERDALSRYASQNREKLTTVEAERDSLLARVGDLEISAQTQEAQREEDSRAERILVKKRIDEIVALEAERDGLLSRIRALESNVTPQQHESALPDPPSVAATTSFSKLLGPDGIPTQIMDSKLRRSHRWFVHLFFDKSFPRPLTAVRLLLLTICLVAITAILFSRSNIADLGTDPYVMPSLLIYGVIALIAFMISVLVRFRGRFKYSILLIGAGILTVASIADGGARHADEIIFHYGFGANYMTEWTSLLRYELKAAIPVVAVQVLLVTVFAMLLGSGRIRAVLGRPAAATFSLPRSTLGDSKP